MREKNLRRIDSEQGGRATLEHDVRHAVILRPPEDAVGGLAPDASPELG